LRPRGGRNYPGGRAAPPLPGPNPSPVRPKESTWRRLFAAAARASGFCGPRGATTPLLAKPTAGGVGVVPHSERKPGSGPKGVRGREAARRVRGREIVIPLAGGESEGDHTVRPWGGRPVPFYSKAYPARRRACRRWSDQPVKELQHIWVHSEQTFRRILCRYRIFLAGRSWRGWPQGRTGPRGPCAAGEAARRAGAPNG
jgi:hypothetical protein